VERKPLVANPEWMRKSKILLCVEGVRRREGSNSHRRDDRIREVRGKPKKLRCKFVQGKEKKKKKMPPRVACLGGGSGRHKQEGSFPSPFGWR